jgi:hypothetical protein
MLFEALLMGQRPIAMKYVEFEQFWPLCGIPAVHNTEELTNLVEQWEVGEFSPAPDKLAWAAQQLSNGLFDGQAAQRIQHELTQLATEQWVLDPLPSPQQRLLTQHPMPLGTVALPNYLTDANVLEGSQAYLLPLLNARHRLCGNPADKRELANLAGVDCFLQWGNTPLNLEQIAPTLSKGQRASFERKHQQQLLNRYLNKPQFVVEDGFIRSVGIGLTNTPTLSVILDEVAAYYDATQKTSLQQYLNREEFTLTPQQQAEAERLIERIVSLRISKYNDAMHFKPNLGRPNHPKVLLVDQRFGDQSVASGLADEQSFKRMLAYALGHFADYDIVIKQHPDALKGGKSSYFCNDTLAPFIQHGNVIVVDFDINPYSLFDCVETVMVVTSGMGFEALMAGKQVHTFGAPFYAGRGLTHDHVTAIPHRHVNRSLAEVFYVAYQHFSRYYSPLLERRCSLDEVIDAIVAQRGW